MLFEGPYLLLDLLAGPGFKTLCQLREAPHELLICLL